MLRYEGHKLFTAMQILADEIINSCEWNALR